MYKKIISFILCAVVAGSCLLPPSQLFAETGVATPEYDRTEQGKSKKADKILAQAEQQQQPTEPEQIPPPVPGRLQPTEPGQPQSGLPLTAPPQPVTPPSTGVTPPSTGVTPPSTGVTPPSTDVTPPSSGKARSKRSKQTEGKKGEVSFFFDDADIFEVAQTVFGDVLGVNYLIDPKVTGRVNFRTVTPIPKSEVLPVMEVIFRLNGIGFLVEEGLYRIVPLSDVSRELVYAQVGKDPGKVAMELFTFKNLSLRDSMKDIENALGLSVKGGKIRVLPIYRLNALLVVASTKEQLDYVRGWVSTFDQLFNGAKPTVYVYSVQNGKAVDVANMLQEIFLGSKAPAQSSAGTSKATQQPAKYPADAAKMPGAQGTAGQPATPSIPSFSPAPSGGESLVSEITRIIPDEITNTIAILATPEDYARMLDTLRQIDIVPRQVMIEAMVAEVTLTDNLRFGLQWMIQNDLKLQMDPFKNDINLNGPITFQAPIQDATLVYTAIDLNNQVKLKIQSLADNNKAKILSSPHVLVSDNREARIQVGDQIPISTQTATTPLSGGNNVTNSVVSTIQYKDTGTILKVKPQVNDSGLVALEISQEVSKANATPILGTLQYVITKREISTNLVVQDGQTIVLGGLIDETTSRGRSGIPFLSKIPVLGYLFGSTINDTARTELIILLTPHVIRNQQEAGKTASDYRNRFERDTRVNIDEFNKDKGKEKPDGGDAGNGTLK
jgi:type II secretion system protein D